MGKLKFITPVEEERKLKTLILGESNSGKTFTMLRLAAEFGKRWAALVVEADADRFDEYRRNPHAPRGGWKSWVKVKRSKTNFTSQLYADAIETAVEEGFDGIMIDGLASNWVWTNRIVSDIDEEERSAGHKQPMSGWTKRGGGNDVYEILCHAIYTCSIHLIATCRSTTRYMISEGEDDRGRKRTKVERVENAIAHRDSKDAIKFRFNEVLLMDVDHNGEFLRPSGEAWPEFSGLKKKPGKEVAGMLKRRLESM